MSSRVDGGRGPTSSKAALATGNAEDELRPVEASVVVLSSEAKRKERRGYG